MREFIFNCCAVVWVYLGGLNLLLVGLRMYGILPGRVMVHVVGTVASVLLAGAFLTAARRR